MRLKRAKTAARQDWEPLDDEGKLIWVKKHADRVYPLWRLDYPEFSIKIADEENERLDQLIKVNKKNGKIVVEDEEEKKRYIEEVIVARVKKEHIEWEKEMYPHHFDENGEKVGSGFVMDGLYSASGDLDGNIVYARDPSIYKQ